MVLNSSETTSLVGPTGYQIRDQDQPSGWALMGDQGGLVPGGPYCWGAHHPVYKGDGRETLAGLPSDSAIHCYL